MSSKIKICSEFWPNGQVKSFGLIKEGEWHGVVQGFWANGQPDFQQSFSDGITNGPYQFFFPNGQVEETGVFIEGENYGVTESFGIDGHLRQRFIHKSQAIHGLWPIQHENATLIDRGSRFEMVYELDPNVQASEIWN
jgi:antitoxin component YwqK of YwqJK toxin-antitoxin module